MFAMPTGNTLPGPARGGSAESLEHSRGNNRFMIPVDEALQLVLQEVVRLPAETRSTVAALGFVLAEDIASDIDSPPHDKSLVDGYAVRSADLQKLPVELQVLEEVVAGQTPNREVTAGAATRIMTGAPTPSGADAVVMVEQTETTADGQTVRVKEGSLRPGQNIMRRAASMARGDVVLRAGRRIRPIEVGLLSEVGRAQVAVYPAPRVAILSTGDELTPVDVQPGPGQIRNSNGPMLTALSLRAGGQTEPLPVARDDRQHLRQLIDRGLQADVLVLSGGVSAGVRDLAPQVLEEAGVRPVFHKVQLKPGKPLWFGVRGETEQSRTLVFGLPGNPVSSLVCFELFVRPALAALAGDRRSLLQFPAVLGAPFTHRGNRPTYYPARQSFGTDRVAADRAVEERLPVESATVTGGGPEPAADASSSAEEGNERVPAETVWPLEWRGSADLCTLSEADCLLYFPAGDCAYRAGSPVAAFRLE